MALNVRVVVDLVLVTEEQTTCCHLVAKASIVAWPCWPPLGVFTPGAGSFVAGGKRGRGKRRDSCRGALRTSSFPLGMELVVQL